MLPARRGALRLNVEATNLFTRAVRVARLALHVACGLVWAAVFFPFYSKAKRGHRVRRWSARLLVLLAVRPQISGTPPSAGAAPAMLVANHVSWLDIFALNAVQPSRFVAKSEIRRWPLIGWMVAQGGTLFLDRSRRAHIAQINREVEAALRQGDTFAVFPEGSITTGDRLLPFHASLLQPALSCNAMIHPVAIRYTRADGSLCSEADYEGEKTMLDSLLAMLTQPVIHVRLHFLPPFPCDGRHRRDLAHEAERLIANALDLPLPRRPARKASGLAV